MLYTDEFQKPERMAQSNAWKHLKKLMRLQQEAEQKISRVKPGTVEAERLQAVIERAEAELRKHGGI